MRIGSCTAGSRRGGTRLDECSHVKRRNSGSIDRSARYNVAVRALRAQCKSQVSSRAMQFVNWYTSRCLTKAIKRLGLPKSYVSSRTSLMAVSSYDASFRNMHVAVSCMTKTFRLVLKL